MIIMALLLVVVAAVVCEDKRLASVLVKLLVLHSKPTFLYFSFSCWLSARHISLLPAGSMLSLPRGVT